MAWLPVRTNPLCTDAANRLPWTLRSLTLPPVRLATARAASRASFSPPLCSPQPRLLPRPALGAGPVDLPSPRCLSPPSANRHRSSQKHGFPSAPRQGLPLSLLRRRRPSPAAPAARGRRKSRGANEEDGDGEPGKRFGRALRRPARAPTIPPRARPPARGRRSPQLTSLRVRAPLPIPPRVPGCRGQSRLPRRPRCTCGSRYHLKFCGACSGGARGRGRHRPRTLGAPCAAADAIVCPAPCLSLRLGSVSDGVRRRGAVGRHRRRPDRGSLALSPLLSGTHCC